MKVPLLDLKPQYSTIKEEVLAVTQEIFDSQYFILGPRVEALEADIADYCQVAHAVGVSSGSDALILSLMAAGIGPGDMVLTTPYTFFATAGAIVRVGARPVFADIEPDSYNLSPAAAEAVVAAMTLDEKSRLKAIIPVHLYGQCADMDAMNAIAKACDLVVIEDAAQAIGSEYKGRRAGAMGDFGCFSFFPSKNLGAFGDGGMVTTGSKDLYDRLRILRGHGASPKYHHKVIGGNFRIDALQAAIVNIKLRYLDRWTAARQDNARQYRELFGAAGLDARVVLPAEVQSRHIYNQFVIRVAEGRDALREFLLRSQVGTEIYYPVPMHLQQCFSDLGHGPGDFPEAEAAAAQTLALPIYPELTSDQLAFVVEKIQHFFA
ncbi:MAG: DegT/DnrJ/EryC1/StrS family aminotransferase [Desulfobacterales bacterium]|nr:DegT/DnrJ/EryC1/StrS family aminotransferase [Desulfobacterales bacterium]